MMTETDAAQIAKLLNDRNQLAKAYTKRSLLTAVASLAPELARLQTVLKTRGGDGCTEQ
jgi:hypothetical protein